jgi:hypothetical protein
MRRKGRAAARCVSRERHRFEVSLPLGLLGQMSVTSGSRAGEGGITSLGANRENSGLEVRGLFQSHTDLLEPADPLRCMGFKEGRSRQPSTFQANWLTGSFTGKQCRIAVFAREPRKPDDTLHRPVLDRSADGRHVLSPTAGIGSTVPLSRPRGWGRVLVEVRRGRGRRRHPPREPLRGLWRTEGAGRPLSLTGVQGERQCGEEESVRAETVVLRGRRAASRGR